MTNASAGFGAASRIHFAPRRNWINDPNGLVFHKGRYHLFFQHNPDGIEHTNMSWGHASSADLVHWDEHPLALRYDDEAEIYSGSVVYDEQGTAGFGPALVAVYTSASRQRDRQAQAIAYSTDDGETWTQYEGNPVLDRGSREFRDPKVFRYSGEAGEYWVMVTVEAIERRVLLYRSDDLKEWAYLSDYGPAGAIGGVWECPDLFPLAVDGDPSDVRWVLLISLTMGSVAGGAGTQYVVGSFDGTTFRPDVPRPGLISPVSIDGLPSREELDACDWLDFGRDNYAGVTFSGLPDEDRTLIAWMNNWDYARSMPYREDDPRRGIMTLARRLSLVAVDGRPRLRQTPVVPETSELASVEDVRAHDLTRLPLSLPECARVDLAIELDEAHSVVVRLRHDDEGRGGVELAYDRRSGRLGIDRSAVVGDFPPSFASVQSTLTAGGSRLALTLWIDVTSIEAFADDGVAVLTDLLDAAAGDAVSVEGLGGSVRIERLVVSTPVPASASTAAPAATATSAAASASAA